MTILVALAIFNIVLAGACYSLASLHWMLESRKPALVSFAVGTLALGMGTLVLMTR